MIFVHSFWAKPLLNNKFNDFSEHLPIVLSNYAYSVACVKHFGHKIKLYADPVGAKMLKFLPYDEIIEIEGMENESIHFAAQIKFEALKRMSLDECLIDGDLFLRRPSVYEILESIHTDFLYSFFEGNDFILKRNEKAATETYTDSLSIMKKYRDEFKPPYTLDDDLRKYQWPNTSFMRFGNQELKDKYIAQYEYHKNLLRDETFKRWPDVIIEQYHMYKLLSTGYKSRPIIYGFASRTTNDYSYLIGFCHLGGDKYALKDRVFEWLEEMDPEIYLSLNNELKKYEDKSSERVLLLT